MRDIAIYIVSAIAEIGGCFAFWAWLRGGASPLWLLPGAGCLAFFAWSLTQSHSDFAGRAYAAYGGIYIVVALLWLVLVEQAKPDRWDGLGAGLALLGAMIILWGPRGP